MTCYVCNAPTAPATPTSVYLRVGTTDYNLSTSSSSPTVIDYRNGGTIKVFSNSTTTNYKYDVYNAYTGGTSLLDYAGTTQVQPASGSLTYSSIGRFEARHYNFKCPDNSRNYSGTRTGYFCMETSAPSISASNSSNSWFPEQRTAVVSSSQPGTCTGLAEVRYNWGSSSAMNSACNSGGTVTSNGASLSAPSGGTTLFLCARNTAGMVSTWSGNYRWEPIAPSVSASNSSDSWFDNQRTAVVSASDTGGSGLAEVRYNWGSSSAMNSACNSGGTVTSNGASLSAPSGGTTLYLCARDNAGNTKTWSGNYRWCTPSTPLNPSSISIKSTVGDSTIWQRILSTSLRNPTRLPLLNSNAVGTVYVPQQTSQPSCTSEYGYRYTGSGGTQEYVHSDYIHLFDPQSGLQTGGATGSVTGAYYTVSMAGTKLYSPSPVTGYYRVNNNPDFGCPNIVNKEKDGISPRGCVSATYTSTGVNNPLKFEIIGRDLDGVDEIKGAIVWLSKDGTIEQIPDLSAIAGTYTVSDPNHIAVMIMQRDGSWDNSPLIYAPDSTNGYNWGNITSHRELRTTDGVMAEVGNVGVKVDGGNVHFYIELSFNEVTSDQTVYPEGNYNISGLVFDEHMLYGNVVDQFYMSTDCRSGGWNIDLRRPVFESESPATKTLFSRNLSFLWYLNGTGSYATDVVVNGYTYALGGEIKWESYPEEPKPTITLTAPPLHDEEIGVMTDTNAWDVVNSVESENYDSDITINIGSKDEGTIILYATGFDQACNDTIGNSVTIDINPWLTSKGGFVYSGENVGAHAKDYTAYEDFINSVLRKVTANELDIGTEVVTSRLGTINKFVRPGLQAVRASNIYNSNSQMSSWYEYFSDRLNKQMVALGQNNYKSFDFPDKIEKNRISDYCFNPFPPQPEYCYMNIQGDLNVVPSYIKTAGGERRKELICDKKTLIMASGNIHIEPDIINGGDGNINGCIFIAGGSITVGAGDWVTQNASEMDETKYDYLDAYLVADDIIDIQLVDIREPGPAGSEIFTRDGLEIYGGLVAFGRNIPPPGISAVQANRSFGLWNAYIPTTVITWDPRYAKLSEVFFGSMAPIYKREVGFKPY